MKPIIANPEIEEMEDFEYSSPAEDIVLLNNVELEALGKEELEGYLSKVYKTAVSNASTKDKLNLMNYIVTIIQNSNNANLMFESLFMDLFVKLLKTVKTKQFKVVLCTILGLCLRHATIVNEDIPKLGLVGIFLELLKDTNNSVRRRAIAALGEYLFYSSDQLDGTSKNEQWEISSSAVNALLKILKSANEDEVIKHYAAKTVENIVCKSKIGGAADRFCTPEFIQVCLSLYKNSKCQGIRNSAMVILASVCSLLPQYIKEVVRLLEIKNIISQAVDSEKKVQQALIKLFTLHIIYGDREAIREIFDSLKCTLPFLLSFVEHGSVAIKGKTLLVFTLLIIEEPSLLTDSSMGKLFSQLDKFSNNKSKHIKAVLREFLVILDFELDRCLEIGDRDFEGAINISTQDEPDREGDSSSYDAMVDILNLISAILSSGYVQEAILNDNKVARLFSLTRFYEPFVVRSSSAEVWSNNRRNKYPRWYF